VGNIALPSNPGVSGVGTGLAIPASVANGISFLAGRIMLDTCERPVLERDCCVNKTPIGTPTSGTQESAGVDAMPSTPQAQWCSTVSQIMEMPSAAAFALDGEPVKIQVSDEIIASPTDSTPVKVELPMKLLRGGAAVQMSPCNGDRENDSDSGIPERSLSMPDVWTTPLIGHWNASSPVTGPKLPTTPEISAPSPMIDSPPGLPAMLFPDAPPPTGMSSAEAPNGGSTLHASGKCRPCAWYWKPGGCLNATDCSYCHLCPQGELKARKKTKVAMMRLGIVTPKSKGGPQRDAANILRLASVL